MEQFQFEVTTIGERESCRLTCTFCAATITFGQANHARHYKDQHVKHCKPERTALQVQCPMETIIPGPGGMWMVRCILMAGHPEGPEFQFFSDLDGHIWPRLDGPTGPRGMGLKVSNNAV